MLARPSTRTLSALANPNTPDNIHKKQEPREVLLDRLARLLNHAFCNMLRDRRDKTGSTAVTALPDEHGRPKLYIATQNAVEELKIRQGIVNLKRKFMEQRGIHPRSRETYIERKRVKLENTIATYTDAHVLNKFHTTKRLTRNDGTPSDLNDLIEGREKTILGIQDDIDLAIMASYYFEEGYPEEYAILESLFDQNNWQYLSNRSIHGRYADGYHPHPELTLVEYVNGEEKELLLPRLPTIPSDRGVQVPYLYVGSGIKCCGKCFTLLNGESQSSNTFGGFNGAYLQNGFVVFTGGHYDSGYPEYWIPRTIQTSLGMGNDSLQAVLNRNTQPSMLLLGKDRAGFFKTKLQSDDIDMSRLQHASMQTSSSRAIQNQPRGSTQTSTSSHSQAAATFASKAAGDSSASFWGKLNPTALNSTDTQATLSTRVKDSHASSTSLVATTSPQESTTCTSGKKAQGGAASATPTADNHDDDSASFWSKLKK